MFHYLILFSFLVAHCFLANVYTCWRLQSCEYLAVTATFGKWFSYVKSGTFQLSEESFWLVFSKIAPELRNTL